MSKSTGVICVEDEIKSACNKLINYIDYLERKKNDFTTILAAVQQCGIKDDLISSRLSEIAELTSIPSKTVSLSMEYSAKPTISSFVNELSKADDFKYPESFLDDIRAILKQFL